MDARGNSKMSDQRLTSFAQGAGCAAKIGAGELSKVTSSLPNYTSSKLLLGFGSSDDACVFDIGGGMVLIQTVDFFPPMVDDPYIFGQIAAANALSDIYAMGAEPKLALNLLCYPTCLSRETVRQILLGGHDKAIEAGCTIAGGHTIEDASPKYGLCVSGFCRIDEVKNNAGAKASDVLVLTKPLGFGILSTALRAGFLSDLDYKNLISKMTELNKYALDAATELDIHACTDVTGFGLLGHAREMADASNVTLEIDTSRLPIMSAASEYAKMGMIPAGAYRNREFLAGRVSFRSGIEQHIEDILFDPQTSGGLLFSLPVKDAEKLVSRMDSARIVGRVMERGEKTIEVV